MIAVTVQSVAATSESRIKFPAKNGGLRSAVLLRASRAVAADTAGKSADRVSRIQPDSPGIRPAR
jgi:hypothetical protein